MKQKLTLDGQRWLASGYSPGAYPIRGGFPSGGEPRRIADFEPEPMRGGAPTTHALQQLQAFAYAKTQMGFDDGPVRFACNWLWFPSTLFTADNNGWMQG